MTAPGASIPAPTGPLRYWVRRRPLELLPVVGMAIALISFGAVTLGVMRGGGFHNMWVNIVAHAYVLAWLLLASSTVRTVGVRNVMMMFLSGFFLSTMISYWTTASVVNRFGANNLTAAVWVPLLEEIAKAVPLLLMMLGYHFRYARDHGVTDLVILGFAAGAGVAIHEDTLFDRSVASGGSGTLSGAFDGGWGLLFPTHFEYGELLTIGHPGWGAFIGLGLGLASIFRRHRILALCFAVGGLGLAVFDHGSWNYEGSLESLFSLITLDHHAPAYLLLLVIPLAIGFDIMRRRHRPPALPEPRLRLYPELWRHTGHPLPGLLAVLALSHYRRIWTSAAYARARDESIPDLRSDESLLAWFRLAMVNKPHRPGGAAPPVPPPPLVSHPPAHHPPVQPPPGRAPYPPVVYPPVPPPPGSVA